MTKIFYSFGKSIFDEQSWAISFLKNQYLMINGHSILVNKNEEYILFKDANLKENIVMQDSLVLLLKSIKQTFNNSMVTNQMRVNEY